MPIPLIVMGVAAVASAKIKSNAAKNAAKEQQKGTDQALQVQTQANQPYMQLGQAAAGRLGEMTANWQPFNQQFQPRQPGQPAPSGFQAPSMTLGSIGQPPQPQMGMPGTPDQQRGMLDAVRAGRSGMPQGAPQGPGGPPQGGLVTLQAPTGETVQMPDGPMVQQAIQRGARRLA